MRRDRAGKLILSAVFSAADVRTRWHFACAIMLLCAVVFLTNRARDDNHWSCWELGDMQTMLSVKHWNERGWLANKLLFIPQGYAKAVEFLDEPQLRHHAHGISPGSSPLVGPRLWYTHYPSGYLVPLATLSKLGFTSKFDLQVLSILFSASAVGLFYLLICRLASPPIAFFSALFYVASPYFHFFADSLANQPLDDLLRFAFMLAIVMSTRDQQEIRNRWNLLAWLVQFCLSLSSLDSVFFFYTWLVGWDLIERKGFRWKRWLMFALAPVLAHGLQFLQNIWYLGVDDALRDALGTFGAKSIATAGASTRIGEIVKTFTGMTDMLFGTSWVFLIVLLMLAFHYRTTRSRVGRSGDGLVPMSHPASPAGDEAAPWASFPPLRVVLLFGAAGLPFIVVLPGAAGMFYEPRQLLPFAAILMGVLWWRLVLSVGRLMRRDFSEDSLSGRRASLAFALLFIVSVFVFVMSGAPKKSFPPAEYLSRMNVGFRKDMSLAGELGGKLPAGKDVIIFSLNGFGMLWDDAYVEGFPQVCPVLEYITGRPILCFHKPEDLAKDLRELIVLGAGNFIPIIGTGNDETLQKVLASLEKEGVIDISKVGRIPMSAGAFADLSGAVKVLSSGGPLLGGQVTLSGAR
jgi:hypothetical protein